MGKRGQPMRQHQGVSRTRLLRHRHPPPVLQVDNADAKPIDDTVVSVIPSHCEPLLPELNCLGNIGFEFLFCLYLHTALFCQYIYLYKTVWWYPISLPPSNTSLNFHQIDRTVTFFLSAFMFRRLIWTLLWDFFRPDTKNSTGIMAWLFCSCVIGLVWVCSIFTPILRLFPTTSWLNMTVLGYPILLWFPITALSGDSCLSLIASWMGTVDSPRAAGTETAEAIFSRHQLAYDTNLTRLAHAIASGNRKSSENPPEKSEETFKMYREMKLLCQDFNSRLSEILFCSMVCAFYVGLVPMFFMKSHQYYDMNWSLLHSVLVLINTFGLLTSHLFEPQYVHFMHKCVAWHEHLKLHEARDACDEKSEASSNTPAASDSSAGEKERLEDDASTSRLCWVFRTLPRLIDILLACHVLTVALQLYLLVTASKWDRLISLALMQFFSYYVLFRATRDRIVMHKSQKLHAQIS